jgi:hypothetical protein
VARGRLILAVLPDHERDQLGSPKGAVGRRLLSEYEAVLLSLIGLAALDGWPELELPKPFDRVGRS